MRIILQLSKEDLKLAADEAMALCGKALGSDGNIIIVDTASDAYRRLAYARQAGELLFSCPKEDAAEGLGSHAWEGLSFRVRKYGESSLSERELAGFIWKSLKDPKVDMDNPEATYDLFFTEKSLYVGRRIWTNDSDFESRKAHRRPRVHPTSMHPKLARALVNLTGAADKVFDPFCGSGGILIEAALMGLDATGYDIDDGMLRRAEENLAHFNVKATLEKRDATTVKEMDYIATDLPYGRNSKAEDLETLYAKFLSGLKFKRAVISFPTGVDVDKLLKDAGFTIKEEYSHYLHRSLSKRIVVL